MAASCHLDMQIGEQPSDGADRVHNDQVMDDKSGQQHRLALLDPAHTSRIRRQWQLPSATHLVPTIAGRGDDEHPSVRLDVEVMSRLPAQRAQDVLRGHSATAGWEGRPQQKFSGIDGRR
ncbi:hypothetical protein [Micromonospora echinofusca]|uniref:hypothetical protein n=1 Tax=Micromonospora echinofusca TaxID=47858 RepID=UPI0015616D98|nr:hypothetical protein [Micromonospora echinofusca]